MSYLLMNSFQSGMALCTLYQPSLVSSSDSDQLTRVFGEVPLAGHTSGGVERERLHRMWQGVPVTGDDSVAHNHKNAWVFFYAPLYINQGQ